MSLRHYEPVLITLFRFGDAFMAGVTSYILLVVFRSNQTHAGEVSVLAALLSIIVFTYKGVYRSWRVSSVYEEIKRLFESCLVTYLLYFSMLYLFLPKVMHPGWGMLAWMIAWPLLLFSERLVVRFSLRYFRKNGRNTKSAVIAGTGKLGIKLAQWVNENPWSGTKIVGFFNGVDKTEIEGYPILGSYVTLPDFVKSKSIDTVYIALPSNQTNKIKWLVEALYDSTASIQIVPDVFSYDYMRSTCVRYIDEMPVISVAESPMSGLKPVLKRIEDIVLSSIILVLVSPVMLFAAVGIKLSDSGSILFKQWRYGLNGEKICVWKFRTMKVSEDGYQFNQVVKSDPRVTRFGAFLRKTSIDEFPQFINVLQGKMSIVGPRPHAISMVDEYRKKFNGSMRRHLIRPGITGLAQIYGTRGMITNDSLIADRIYYDMKYIKEWTLFLDLKIIVMTVVSLFRKEVH